MASRQVPAASASASGSSSRMPRSPIGDEPGLLPLPQAAVHRLAAAADHRGEGALGVGHAGAAVAGVRAGAGDQHLGEAAGQVGEGEVGDVGVGLAQPAADHPQHRLGEPPVVLEQRQEVAALEGQQRAVGRGRGVGRPRAAVEQRDLAEDRAGAELGEQEGPALRRRIADPDRAAAHQHHRGAGIVHDEDRRAGGPGARPRGGEEAVALRGVEEREQEGPAQGLLDLRPALCHRARRLPVFRPSVTGVTEGRRRSMLLRSARRREPFVRARVPSLRAGVGCGPDWGAAEHGCSGRAPRSERTKAQSSSTKTSSRFLRTDGSTATTIASAASASSVAEIGRVEEDHRVAARDDHRPAQMLLEQRAEDEAEQQRRRLAAELDEHVADHAEDGDRRRRRSCCRRSRSSRAQAKTMIAGKSTR